MTTTTTGTAPAAQLATYGRKVIATALEGRYYLADDVLAALHAAGLAIVTAADPETVTTPTTGTAPLIVRLTEAILELDRLNGELDTASVHDAIADVLRQTTGTAPLIERLVAALRARYGHTKTGRPDLVASAWRDDAYAILEALAPAEVAASDGLWVEFADPDCSCCKGTGWRLQRGWEPGTATTKYPCECHRYHKERQIDAALQASAPATTARDERERSGAR
jgi:hypothetical protein